MKKVLFLALFIICLCSSSICTFSKEVKDAEYYYKQGQDYEWKNNRLGAIDAYSEALNVNPDYDKARIARAKLCMIFEKYEDALIDYEYFYNKSGYGPVVYFEDRIECKKKLGKIPEALDDMYEVILVYGGQAKVLKNMLDTVNEYPEYEFKLKPVAHADLIAKYKSKAKALRDYAVTFNDDKLSSIKNPEYYKFFMDIATAMDPQIATEAYNPSNLSDDYRKAPADKNCEVLDMEKINK